MTASPTAPAVPSGPGVQPPFIAAPIEGRNARRWLAAGLIAAVVAMCCGVGAFSVGGLVFTMVPALNEQAHRATSEYLDALIEGNWEQAYDQLCEADREAESLEEFTDRVSQPRIESYDLGELDLTDMQSDTLRLPVDLTYTNGRSERVTYPLVPAQEGGRLQVCEHG